MHLVCNKGIPLHEIAKGTNWLLNLLFSCALAEHVTFDVYAGIAVHGFLIATNSSDYLLFVCYK